MTLVIFVLPLLAAVAAWLLFFHLARSGRQVVLPTAEAEALRLACERIRATQTLFDQLGMAAAQATVSFNEVGRVLREALERSTSDGASR